MKTPLIRQGEGPAAAHARRLDELEAERRKLERAISIAQTTELAPAGNRIGYRSAPGDLQRLRAIPCIAEGVGGTIPGTNPLAALIAKERRQAA